MKIQHLAILFIVIIVPISIVLSEYVSAQIKTITLQTQYTNCLTASTYDMMKAFQLNTVNNQFSAVSDSKIRDLEAAINTFYTSMGNSSVTRGMTKEILLNYTPCVLCTLYDGYYIYSKYSNAIPEDDGSYTIQYGLKPYIYYSCRYKKGSDDFVVNYTLDNAITIYGWIDGQYETRTGYLVNPDNCVFSEVLAAEVVSETLGILKDDSSDFDLPNRSYSYVVINNEKVYYDSFGSPPAGASRYFWYRNGKKMYISDEQTINVANSRFGGGQLVCDSASKYTQEAIAFSMWVRGKLGNITQNDARRSDQTDPNPLELDVDLGTAKIFDLGNSNDPLKEDSTFNSHRMAVIRESINTNLKVAIANYNDMAEVDYMFGLPKFTEIDWDKILNNICFVSFLQGIPIGTKYYNNYVVITNDSNKEFVSQDSIYIVDKTNNIYHQPGCPILFENGSGVDIGNLQGYSNINFLMKNITVSEDTIFHFYSQGDTSACYHCIVNAGYLFDLDDIMFNTVVAAQGHSVDDGAKNAVRKAYLTALARERYNLYRTNGYFGTGI